MTIRRTAPLALQTAKAAVAAFERERVNGKFMRVERQTLQRLRSDERFGEAWHQIEAHCRGNEDRRRLIIPSIIYAARVSLEAPDVFSGKKLVTEGWKQARQHAAALRAFLTEKVRFQNGQSDPLVRSLSSLLETIEVFRLCELDVTTLTAMHGLTREYRSLAGQRATFMARLSKSIVDIFGKPLDGPVALITEIVLETEATIGQVRGARRQGERFAKVRSVRPHRTGALNRKK
jgi:hypothetical protein